MTFSTRAMKIALVGVLAAASARAGDQLKITGEIFDFGTVVQNSTYAHQVWIRSESDDTLTVTEIKVGCGCLTAKSDSSTLAPGDSLSVILYWQTRGSEGHVDKSALIYSSSGQRPAELSFEANVVTSLDSDASLVYMPQRVVFSGQEQDQPVSRSISFTNRSEQDLALAVIAKGAEFELNLANSIGAGATVVGHVVVAEDSKSQEFESSFTVELTGNQGAPYRVSVPVVSGDFSFRPMFTTTKE
jgi:hypothetical protein